jgi:hypothetical protein
MTYMDPLHPTSLFRAVFLEVNLCDRLLAMVSFDGLVKESRMITAESTNPKG